MTVNYKQYNEDKKVFFQKHNYDFQCETSSMDGYGRYYKVYSFTDGAQWYENMSPTYESAEVEIKMVVVTVEVKMFRTEYYNTDDSTSKCYYEKF